jgi:hypothetical protein
MLSRNVKSSRSFQTINRCSLIASHNGEAALRIRIPRTCARPSNKCNMATIASFKIPKVSNEPNVSYLAMKLFAVWGLLLIRGCSITMLKGRNNEQV